MVKRLHAEPVQHTGLRILSCTSNMGQAGFKDLQIQLDLHAGRVPCLRM